MTLPATQRALLVLLLAIGLLIMPFPVAAAMADHDRIAWFPLLIGLGGGLALFLAGLEQLADGLKKAAGESMKTMLARLTTNRVTGALTGAVVTGMLNSSSITTVLVVGFVTAGIMSLSQSVGIIMGANIGSTVTAQILAFNISQYALLPIAIGFFLIFTERSERLKYIGMVTMGIGLVFFGMAIMSDAMAPLRSHEPFLELLKKMSNPYLGIIVGALFTGIVQSSAATVGIAIALASEGFLTLEAGIALALGANIGTCITALLAGVGKPPEAVRAAVVHITFNIAGVLVWLFFIPHLAELAVRLSPSYPELSSTAQLAAEVPRQIANANTLFNIINTCLFLPFTGVFAWAASKLVPDRQPEPGPIQPIFLDESLIGVPTVALEHVRMELARASELVLAMFDRIKDALPHDDIKQIQSLIKEDDKIDILDAACIEFLSKIRKQQLTTAESLEHQTLMVTSVALEHLADVIEKDLVDLGEEAIKLQHVRSKETIRLTDGLYQCIRDCLDMLVHVLRDHDQEAARVILRRHKMMKTLTRELMARKSYRFGYDDRAALRTARIEISMSDKLNRMYQLIRTITEENLKKSQRADQ